MMETNDHVLQFITGCGYILCTIVLWGLLNMLPLCPGTMNKLKSVLKDLASRTPGHLFINYLLHVGLFQKLIPIYFHWIMPLLLYSNCCYLSII